MKAAERFFAEAIAEYGIEEGDVVRIPMTQCELARRRKRAASTVGYYLTAMGPRVLSRTPHIRIERHSNGSQICPQPIGNELLEAYQALVAAQARVIALQPAGGHSEDTAGSRRGQVRVNRGSREVSRGFVRGSRGFVRGSRGNARAVSKEGKENLLPSFQEPANESATLFTDVADHGNPAKASTTHVLSDDDIDCLLAPLHRAAAAAGAKRMNNRGLLIEALRPYGPAQISLAVTELVKDLDSRSTAVTSPFGLLVSRARSGTMPTPPTPPNTAQDDGDPKDDGANTAPSISPSTRRAVAALCIDDLDELDAFIDEQIGRCSYRTAGMTAALRLEYFPTWGTTRTPQGHPEVFPRTIEGQA